MKLITYKAHNVLGVKDVQFDLAGRHLFLVGGTNGHTLGRRPRWSRLGTEKHPQGSMSWTLSNSRFQVKRHD